MQISALDNRLVLALMNSALSVPPPQTTQLLETHISWVILAGEYAYKIKKPVNLGFVNFTDLNKRAYFCQEELRLNRRLAPQLYLDLLSIGGSIDQPRLGSTPVIEYAVKMRRFNPDQQLDKLLASNRLPTSAIDQIATTIGQFHLNQPACLPTEQYGTLPEVILPVLQNFHSLHQLVDSSLSGLVSDLQNACEFQISSCAQQLHQRQQQGYIREAHGDLHLANLVMWQNQVLAFDCLEFNPHLRWIDVINDIAFLLMDLQCHQRNDLAYRFLNRYLQLTGDYQGLAVLNYYLVYRALVRAKICLLSPKQTHSLSQNRHCYDYLSLAESYLDKPQAFLILTHGLPGTGKSTLSQWLAEQLACIQLRSDIERKRLLKLAVFSEETLYTTDATAHLYQHLYQLSRQLLSWGYPVIVDATFLKQSQRQLFRQLAKELQLGLVIVSLSTQADLIRQRIHSRSIAGNDASDADLAVVEKMQADQQDLSAEEFSEVIEWDNNQDFKQLEPAKNQLLAAIRQRLLQARWG